MVGEVFIANVTVTPGPNIVQSRVFIDTRAAISNVVSIIQSQKEQLYRGRLGVMVSGKSTVCRGENIAYYESALAKLQLYSMLPISRVLGRTVGGIASSVAPDNILTLLRMTGVMKVLEGNGVDLARLTTTIDQHDRG